ncbi:FAD-dependent oxidoreductase [Lysobacter antibioticus]|uniref:FAD-dependent oxidoreductase n=1 Tax=Lysobacter antibioticus TaxID=84531 RepID=UPI0007170BF0|nr:FAD-dependent oxidoreductase [Lysobacter antibioticus]
MTEPCDVLVIGAGPAGLAAARAAASHGVNVVLVDLQANPGGQIWRHDVRKSAPAAARLAVAEMRARSNLHWLPQAQVVATAPGRVLIEEAGLVREIEYGALVLATGARELLLPFPGWTLPGVSGAGALQALTKQGWPIAGKRVLLAGSGPLLLASAATLRRHGAQVLAICEQAPDAALMAFASQLWRWPGKLLQAAALRTRLAGVAYRRASWVRAAHGDERVREVEIESARGIERIACDQVAVGYGLVPNTELAAQLGCALELDGRHPRVRVDERLMTSVDGVYAAGEACGIGGVDVARVEGAMAGHAAAGADDAARALRPRRRHARAFADLLPRYFDLRDDVRKLAEPTTLVCRCEDVALAQLQGYSDARAAKLATRCGMGSCQGRICGTALTELGLLVPATRAHAARPPVFPTRLASLAAAGSYLDRSCSERTFLTESKGSV